MTLSHWTTVNGLDCEFLSEVDKQILTTSAGCEVSDPDPPSFPEGIINP